MKRIPPSANPFVSLTPLSAATDDQHIIAKADSLK